MAAYEDELHNSIEHLYKVFERYPLRLLVEGCPHCVSGADNDCIHSAPLRQLTSGALSRYAFKAMTTWGDSADFRHFLPRILELMAVEGGGWINAEVVFGKLPYGEFQMWPAEEQKAIEDYSHALWHSVASREHPLDPECCLCSIAQAYDDLAPYLSEWQPARSAGEAIRFAEFVEEQGYGSLKTGLRFVLCNAWWKQRPLQLQQVLDWLISSDRLRELDSAFFSFGSSDELASRFSEACDYLSNLRRAIGCDVE